MPDPFPLTSLADLADGVTVVPFHPKHAQWVKNRVKLLDMVTYQHFFPLVYIYIEYGVLIGRFVEYEYKTRYRKFYNSKTGARIHKTS
jgi:hypothetical protein